MEYVLSAKDKKLLKVAKDTMQKWRKILHIDDMWEIDVEVIDGEEMEGYARLSLSTAEYYITSIELSHYLLTIDEDKFKSKMEVIMCHELIHLVAIDFYRTARIAAEESEGLQEELRYRYEQFTARLQRSFISINEGYIKMAAKMGVLTELLKERNEQEEVNE